MYRRLTQTLPDLRHRSAFLGSPFKCGSIVRETAMVPKAYKNYAIRVGKTA